MKREEEIAVNELRPKEGCFAALYRDKYLDLFPTTQTDTLSDLQTEALEEMRRIVVIDLTTQYRGLLMQRVQEIIKWPGIYNDPVPEDWNAETIAAATCYVFWNRFNCCEEGYEVSFAKSGLLGKYLRSLKVRDK